MKLPILSALLCSVSVVALAQPDAPPPGAPPQQPLPGAVPSLALRDGTRQDLRGVPPTMPPPVPLISPSAPLTMKEQHAATLASQWRGRSEMPVRGENGTVTFLYGATVPSVVCAPLYVCNVALQPGEIVNSVDVGDSVRWKISPAISGFGTNQVTHLLIKPIDAGLRTDMVVTTTKRIYTIKLVSTQHDWTPQIAFNYPDDMQAEWAAYHQQAQFQTAAMSVPGGARSSENIDFDFRLGGDRPDWTPVRVYSDGVKTYIDFPPSVSSTAAPALVALNGGGWFSRPNPQLVNYRMRGDRYVVDGVLDRAALISGVGSSQTRVTITREAAR